MVPLAVFGAAACSGGGGAPAPKAIMDKATPFGDLLVPKLSASVTDGAVGVAVDSPVTVNADDGVLASVEMVNENGGTVDGQLSPDGVRWATTERLGYNRRDTLAAKARGSAAWHTKYQYLNIQPLSLEWRQALTNIAPITHLIFDLTLPRPLPPSSSSGELEFQKIYWDTGIPSEGGTAVLIRDVTTMVSLLLLE